MATVLLIAVTHMPNTACPYCKKTYKKAKHLENHISKKHGRLVDLLSTAKSQIESGDREADVQLPENPLDMTPDLLFELNPGQALVWQRLLFLYKSRAQMLNKIFSICGIRPTTSSYTLSADMTLPPDTDDKSEEMHKLETESIYKKSVEPVLLEMTGLINVLQKRCSNLEDELRQVKSLTDTLVILNLGKTDRSPGIWAG
jgi:hypothetical protein